MEVKNLTLHFFRIYGLKSFFIQVVTNFCFDNLNNNLPFIE